uniref:Uncharacterized protein n=1 Tax=Anguilla anguilla TaxID=7936 RepID=A0A0E9WFB0_ANGAN
MPPDVVVLLFSRPTGVPHGSVSGIIGPHAPLGTSALCSLLVQSPAPLGFPLMLALLFGHRLRPSPQSCWSRCTCNCP